MVFSVTCVASHKLLGWINANSEREATLIADPWFSRILWPEGVTVKRKAATLKTQVPKRRFAFRW